MNYTFLQGSSFLYSFNLTKDKELSTIVIRKKGIRKISILDNYKKRLFLCLLELYWNFVGNPIKFQ